MFVYILVLFIINAIGSLICAVGFYVTPMFSPKSDKFIFIGVAFWLLTLYTGLILIGYFIQMVLVNS